MTRAYIATDGKVSVYLDGKPRGTLRRYDNLDAEIVAQAQEIFWRMAKSVSYVYGMVCYDL